MASPDESRLEPCVIPKVVMFYDRVASGTEDPPIVKDMVENAGKDTPYHFFGLQARTAQKGGHVISTSRTWYKIEKAQGVKAEELSEKAEQLLQMARSGESITLQTKWSPDNDQTVYEGPGNETLCGHLAQLAQITGISALDDKVTLANQLGLPHSCR